MSSVLIIQRHNQLFMGSDTAVSTTINNQIYRINEDGEKLFKIDNFLIFCSGKLEISYKVMKRFKKDKFKSINSLKNIAQNTFNEYKKHNDYNLDILVGTYEDNNTVIYQISPYNKFNVIRQQLNAGQTSVITGGIKTKESYYLACKLLKDNYSTDKIFKSVFDHISFEGVGGNLVVYSLSKDRIEKVIDDKIEEKCIKKLVRNNNGQFELSLTVAERVYGVLGEFVQLRANQIVAGDLGEKISDDLISSAATWNTSVLLGTSYNNVTITALNGVVATRTDLKSRSILSGDGVQIQKNIGTSGSPNWENKLYADSNGDLVLDGKLYAQDILIGGVSILDSGKILGNYIKSITTDQLVAGTAKITTAMIETLTVGTNVTMGANATISWSKVTDQPIIPTVPSYITATKITSTTIESPSITGGSITSGTVINVGTDAIIGNNLTLTGSGNQSIIHNLSSILFKSTGVVEIGAFSWIELGAPAYIMTKQIATQEWVQANAIARFG